MKTVIIGIAGGSASGKSTLTQELKNIYGDRITIIYHDNYYRRHDELTYEQRSLINYDHPDALETSLLIEHLQALKEGRSVECPLYDFTSHNRSDRTQVIKPCRIIIVEGILIFHEDALRDLLDIKIFVEADADERILRRVKRDMVERGRTLDSIISQYLTTVKPMHEKFVEPSKKYADITINSALNEVAKNFIKAHIGNILDKEV